MLQRRFRFRGRSSLRFVYQRGKTYRVDGLSLRAVCNSRLSHNRAAIVVAKKSIKSAPKRNKMRRRLYEILRRHWSSLSVPYDLVLTVHDPSLLDTSPEELTRLLMQLLQQSRVWSEHQNSSDPKSRPQSSQM